ncbi:MAG: RNA polymerase sigma factor [Capsulimonadales bacterium]|nr:RNA polymerase sigma factor [Capsulimonadales bacterium]
MHEENTATPELPDRTLVERTLLGDASAFALLHRRHYHRVFRHALYRTRNVQDAEDIAAETFVRAIGHLAGYRFQGESIYPWLARIATNLILDQGRKFAGTTFVSLEGGDTDGIRNYIEGLRSDDPDPHRLAERQETQVFLRTAIAALPHDQAEAILLRFGGDLPLKEIAQAMNRSEGAIKSLLHRALVNLRRTLTQAEADAAQFSARRVQYNTAQERKDPVRRLAPPQEKPDGNN